MVLWKHFITEIRTDCIKGNMVQWLEMYPSDIFRFVHVNGEPSSHVKFSHGVPQGSILGSILFSLYMLPLGNINRKYLGAFLLLCR